MTMDTLIAATVLGSSAAVVTALIATAKYVGPPLRRLAKQNDEFRDDWYGLPARPGRPAQPGVMERLSRIEEQLHTNGGSTLRDAVARVEQGQRALQTTFDTHVQQSVAMISQLVRPGEIQPNSGPPDPIRHP